MISAERSLAQDVASRFFLLVVAHEKTLPTCFLRLQDFAVKIAIGNSYCRKVFEFPVEVSAPSTLECFGRGVIRKDSSSIESALSYDQVTNCPQHIVETSITLGS